MADYNIENVGFARPIYFNDESLIHAYVNLPNEERRGVFLNVGPLIATKGQNDMVHLQIEETDRFRNSWPALANKAAKHIIETSNGQKLSFNRVLENIENPFKESGLVARLANKLNLKDNRGGLVRSLFPNDSSENGWALLQFESLSRTKDKKIIPKFILHGMLLIREDAPDEFDVMNLTDISPQFADMESQIVIDAPQDTA
jgi:hypothetical protein